VRGAPILPGVSQSSLGGFAFSLGPGEGVLGSVFSPLWGPTKGFPKGGAPRLFFGSRVSKARGRPCGPGFWGRPNSCFRPCGGKGFYPFVQGLFIGPHLVGPSSGGLYPGIFSRLSFRRVPPCGEFLPHMLLC